MLLEKRSPALIPASLNRLVTVLGQQPKIGAISFINKSQ